MTDLGSREIRPTNSNNYKKTLVIWAIVSGIIFIAMVNESSHPEAMNAGFFGKFFALLAAITLGAIGGLIGSYIRDFLKPDMYFSSTYGSFLRTKIFWKIGPQLICCIIGIAIGGGTVLRIWYWWVVL